MLQSQLRETELLLQKEIKEVEVRLTKELELRLQKEIRSVEIRIAETSGI